MTTNRKELTRQRKAQAAAKALDRAVRAMRHYMTAALDCGEHLEADDGRVLLVGSMEEFSGHLDSVYGKGGAA